MGDYVPYEVRRQEERHKREASEAADRAQHAAAVARVQMALAALAGAKTDFFIEILKPANAVTRLVSRKSQVVISGLRGGPRFVIDSVLTAYRVPEGVHSPYVKESGYLSSDAFVVPDGRFWLCAGAKDDENVIQQLATSALPLRELSVHDLTRVAEHLSSLRGSK